MNVTKELGSKSMIAFGGQLLGQLLNAIFVILAGRLLGADAYGQVIYVHTFLTFLGIFTRFGFENGLMAYLSREAISQNRKYGILRFCIAFTVCLSLLIMAIGYLNAQYLGSVILNNDHYIILLKWMLPILVVESVSYLLRSALKGERNIRALVIAENLLLPASKVLFLFPVLMGWSLQAAFVLIAPMYMGNIISILYSAWCLVKKGYAGKVEKPVPYGEILNFSLPLLFAGIVMVVNQNTDKYMLGFMLNASAVAVYNVAIYVGNFSSIALGAVNSIFAPMISNLHHAGKGAELRKLYRQATKWITVINLAVFGIVFLYAREILLLAGEEFAAGASSLIIICLGQVVNCIVGSVGYLNTMMGYPKLDFYSSLAAMLSNVFLNILLIPLWGMTGAAIASAVALALKNIVNFIFLYKNTGMHPYDKSYLHLAGAFLLATAASWIFWKNCFQGYYLAKLFVGAGIFGIVYGICIYRKVLDREEKKLLLGRIRRKEK